LVCAASSFVTFVQEDELGFGEEGSPASVVIVGLLGSILCVLRVGDLQSLLDKCRQSATPSTAVAYTQVSTHSSSLPQPEVEMSPLGNAPEETDSDAESAPLTAPDFIEMQRQGVLQRCASACSGLGVAVPFFLLAFTSKRFAACSSIAHW
jgi:hypothetical protein